MAETAAKDRRKGVTPVPMDLQRYLNDDQMATLRQLENYGWELIFLRRPLFLEPTLVLKHVESGCMAVLDDHGELVQDPDISLRDNSQ